MPHREKRNSFLINSYANAATLLRRRYLLGKRQSEVDLSTLCRLNRDDATFKFKKLFMLAASIVRDSETALEACPCEFLRLYIHQRDAQYNFFSTDTHDV